MTDRAALIALDWGTSSLRAWLLGADGGVLDARRSDRGLLAVTRADGDPTTAWDAAFTDTCGDWLAAHQGVPVLACGMVGSAQGWVDAGYRDVPTALEVGPGDLTAVDHRTGRVHVVPGLRSTAGPGDVIRGEETQVAGVLDALGTAGDLTVVLPGTHSKWVSVRQRRVEAFSTAMTGELYGLLLGDSILARTATHAVRDDEAFRRGVAAASGGRGLQVELFGARALVLAGRLPPGSVPDYVSGVLVGDEVAHLLPRAGAGPVVVCGGEDLCRRYALALAAAGVEAEVHTEDVTVRGLWRTARSAGLVRA